MCPSPAHRALKPRATTMSASVDATPVEPDAMGVRKALIAASWGATAGPYVEQFQDRGVEHETRFDMSKCRKLVVERVVSSMSDKESPVVLDVASAGGEPALSMAKEMPHATVHGTDYVPEMVEHIRKRATGAEVSNLQASVQDGELLSGFTDDSVDAVTCTWGLESMDPALAIQQFHRVLKPAGVALLAVWDEDPNSIMVKIFSVISKLQAKGFDFTHMQALGGNKGKEAMEEAGFEEVTVTPESVAFYVTPAFGYREFFAYMASCTPADTALAYMEKNGRPDIREEACALFEAQILEDIEQGKAPTGPGLPSKQEPKTEIKQDGDEATDGSSKQTAQPAFYVHSLLIQGRKKNG
eukprot:jgi/Undpi1/5300/HiC_scaffold_2.g00581.m1